MAWKAKCGLQIAYTNRHKKLLNTSALHGTDDIDNLVRVSEMLP